MRIRLLVAALILYTIANAIADPSKKNPDDAKEKATMLIRTAHDQWDDFLSRTFKLGQSELEIDKNMSNLFLYKGGYNFSGNGDYIKIYRIDDFHEVIFKFDRFSKLKSNPVVESKQNWLRFPVGQVVRIEKDAPGEGE